MTFQIIAISSLLAFYGCYLGKMLLQKKQGIQTDQQAPTVPDRCAPPQRSVWQWDGVWKVWLFWCIRIGFDWMLDKTEPEFVTIHRASRTVDEDSLSRVIIRLPGESIRCHKFRFRFVLQPSSR